MLVDERVFSRASYPKVSGKSILAKLLLFVREKRLNRLPPFIDKTINYELSPGSEAAATGCAMTNTRSMNTFFALTKR